MVKYEDVKHQTTEDYFNGNKFSIDAFKKKYAMFDGETYVQALWRVCNFIASVEQTEELRKYWAERWFDEIYNDWWHPAGSIMQGAGSGKKISLANCFSRDTKFITDKGLKSFLDFNDGDTVSVMNNYGSFVKSTIKKFGNDRLYKLTVKRDTIIKDIYCTGNHIWRTLKDDCVIEKETLDLEDGDIIPYIKRKWIPSKPSNSRYFCPIGFVHGMVYGDGDYDKSTNTCRLHLSGDSKELIKYFQGFDWSIKTNNETITIKYLPSYFKNTIPKLENFNEEYVLGFLIGYFAANGCMSKDAKAVLSSSKIDDLLEIKDIIESLGIYCSDVKLNRDKSPFDGNENHKLYDLYIWTDCLFDSFFVKENHKENWNNYIINVKPKKINWKVVSVEETERVEDVWCVEVPEDKNFTLAGGINTHNCTTISLGLLKEDEEWDNLESIYKNAAYTVAKCAAYRQGLGVDFCLSPETLILTSDLRQIPVKDINIGDELIGFDENLNLDKNRLKPSVVKSKDIIKRPSYKITTDRGYVIASAEHLWVVRNDKEKPNGRMTCKYEWVATDNLKVGNHIAFSIEPWEEQISKDAGYLSGLLDREGWISKSHSGIRQNEGIVYNKIIELFDFFKIKYNINDGKKCKKITINDKWESIKLLGMFRPPRLLSKSKLLWENKKLTGQKNPYAKIINIEFLGEKEVVALGTSTQTLIANGFLSHNSRLRPRQAKVLNSSNESMGAIHWMEEIDGIGYRVGQKGRIPAMLFSLSCFEENTLIRTSQGLLTIKNICDNFSNYKNLEIWTENGFEPLTGFNTKEEQDIYEIETENGRKIKTTPDHKFMVRNIKTNEEYLKSILEYDAETEELILFDFK